MDLLLLRSGGDLLHGGQGSGPGGPGQHGVSPAEAEGGEDTSGPSVPGGAPLPGAGHTGAQTTAGQPSSSTSNV